MLKFLHGGEPVFLLISVERVWDLTAALTGVDKATAQRILTKKVEQPTLSIEDEL